MIRNVVIHASNEQPLMADLFDLPSAEDAGLLCTNLRMMDGKRPVFIDQIESTFFFPYHVIRFLEMPKDVVPRASARRQAQAARRAAGATRATEQRGRARVAAAGGRGRRATATSEQGDLDIDIEIDEDFLQRVRDI